MANDYCVYMHTFPNKKVYVGITSIDPEKRWNGGHGYRKNHGLFSAILKYGWINIEHKIIASGLSRKQASETEKRLIEEYKSDDLEYGYNLQTGGTKGFTHNQEARKKISESSKRMWADPAKRQALVDIQKKVQADPEVRRRKAEYSKYRYHHDTEYREKLISSIRDRMSKPEVKEEYRQRAKKMWTDSEFRQRWNERMSGANNPTARPVNQYTTDGLFVGGYSCCKEASEITGTCRSSLTSCAKGKQRTAGGYVWRYADV